MLFCPRRASSNHPCVRRPPPTLRAPAEATTPPPSSSSASLAHLRSNSRQADGPGTRSTMTGLPPGRCRPPSGGGAPSAMRRCQLRGGGAAVYRDVSPSISPARRFNVGIAQRYLVAAAAAVARTSSDPSSPPHLKTTNGGATRGGVGRREQTRHVHLLSAPLDHIVIEYPLSSFVRPQGPSHRFVVVVVVRSGGARIELGARG